MIAATRCWRLRVVVVETTRTWEGGSPSCARSCHRSTPTRVSLYRVVRCSTGLHLRRFRSDQRHDGMPFLFPGTAKSPRRRTTSRLWLRRDRRVPRRAGHSRDPLRGGGPLSYLGVCRAGAPDHGALHRQGPVSPPALPRQAILAGQPGAPSRAAGLCGADLAAGQQGPATRPLPGAAGPPGGGTPRRQARADGAELPLHWLLVEWPPGKPAPVKY
jgi:hypothetical protein